MIKINEPQLPWLQTAIYHTCLDVKMEVTQCMYRTRFANPHTLPVCTLQPLKSGRLMNQETFFCPKCVRIKEIPLYIQPHCSLCLTDAAEGNDVCRRTTLLLIFLLDSADLNSALRKCSSAVHTTVVSGALR